MIEWVTQTPFHPHYPGAIIRQGAVTVCVTLSPQGRVTDIENFSASDESFRLATQRHAQLRY